MQPAPTATNTPLPVSTATIANPPTATASPQPTQTNTPEPTATVTSQPISGQTFNAQNAASAQPTELLLSDYPVGVYWPGNSSLLVFLNSTFLEIYLEPLSTGITTPVQAPGAILGIAPDGSQLIYQGGDGGIVQWVRASGESRVIPFGGAAYFAAYSQDGQTIAFGSPDTWRVVLYDAATIAPLKEMTGFETAAPVYSALPGPQRGILAWYARGKLQFQDIATNALGGELGYQDFITGIAFNPDGRKTIVSAGGLLQIITTDVAGGIAAQDLVVVQPDTSITSPVFSPDGDLAAAGVNGNVVIWETTGGTQVAVLPHSSRIVRLVSFSPDGRALVSVDDQNLLKSWRIP